ncbi:VanW like protein [Ureibacillus xyleni]|uniref:VanW like protein n=1 Tax=Ureibacillus xyleni TaxID=614648 RepID=A0A285TJP3_9BACL|nr:VanW family protein [Ureibacillus xyleni]SOC22619.1 VanW like protein [Ureibacillus xyleni]
MKTKCAVFLFTIVLLIPYQTFAFFPFNDVISENRAIKIVDPFSDKIVKEIVPDDLLLLTSFESYKQTIETWVEDFSKGYRKPMILDRLDISGEVIMGRPLITVDEAALVNNILELSFSGGEVELPLIYTESDYKKSDVPYLNEVVLASYTTFFNSANSGRSKNIELSAIAINNVIVGSGDIFSFNTTVGPRDVTTGYQEAPEIIKGKLVMGIGGGICQTSSTLFNAVDLLGVKTIERHRHSRDIGYVPKGRDATVSFGGLDYQFQNTTGIPFIIKTYYLPGVITIQIKTSQEYAEILKNEL